MFDNVLDGNYKGRLLEICAIYFGIKTPEYFHIDYGLPHEKVFLCICIFNNETSSSQGRTKTEAEQFSSKKMLAKIKDRYFKQEKNSWLCLVDEEEPALPEQVLSILSKLQDNPQREIIKLYGDATLRYLIARYLFDNYPQFREDLQTRIISEAMRDESRVVIARKLLPNKFPTSMAVKKVVDLLSSVIGKLVLDDSEVLIKDLLLTYYQVFIERAVATIISDSIVRYKVAANQFITTQIQNAKGKLQEYAQKRSLPIPDYEEIDKYGEDHDQTFICSCSFLDHYAEGSGKTKKSAEQYAAQKILALVNTSNLETNRIISKSSAYAMMSTGFKDFTELELSSLKKQLRCPFLLSSEYLQQAFTTPGQNQNFNYQRLEFLGDAILKKILLAYILQAYSQLCDKATLSPLLDKINSAETQAMIATKLGLSTFIFTNTALTTNILSDVLEALIAAIYLDAEPKQSILAEKIIISWFKETIENTLKIVINTDRDVIKLGKNEIVKSVSTIVSTPIATIEPKATNKQVTQTVLATSSSAQEELTSMAGLSKSAQPLNEHAKNSPMKAATVRPKSSNMALEWPELPITNIQNRIEYKGGDEVKKSHSAFQETKLNSSEKSYAKAAASFSPAPLAIKTSANQEIKKTTQPLDINSFGQFPSLSK